MSSIKEEQGQFVTPERAQSTTREGSNWNQSESQETVERRHSCSEVSYC